MRRSQGREGEGEEGEEEQGERGGAVEEEHGCVTSMGERGRRLITRPAQHVRADPYLFHPMAGVRPTPLSSEVAPHGKTAATTRQRRGVMPPPIDQMERRGASMDRVQHNINKSECTAALMINRRRRWVNRCEEPPPLRSAARISLRPLPLDGVARGALAPMCRPATPEASIMHAGPTSTCMECSDVCDGCRPCGEDL